MAAENLVGNLPNKVGSDYQRPLPRDFEDAGTGSVSWKDETNTYGWDTMPVLPSGKYRGFDTSVSSPADGDIYFGTGDSTTLNSDWNAATVYDWARYTSDTSSWSAITPVEGQLCFDSSGDTWYTFDTTTTGWNEMQMVSSTGNNYTTKTIEIGDWDMDATVGVAVSHGLSATEWKTVRVMDVIIRDDADSGYSPLSSKSSAIDGYLREIEAASINLYRITSGSYDSASYDSTGYNRGWVTIQYTKD